ncbi:nicotinate-nucleotide adenylyltransferase [Alteromonas sp. ASW11-36]|uniref:Probable nicotinate-nucleotide adenylyltransferase n=1 Tax=Alteromonas arenosi TaxID=3055817 RepID=A0ABT7SWS0_9ALTE|nr:nicotinate-nucleotide adenylyltransferase [Alteromonas sp. ASW11-36]MDM7860633.1 nicotinate-nucleotide adenylyltransferase [Alteromonas sp. ASW11-36]
MSSVTSVIGLFGGTFNPPHIGHIEPLLQAAKDFAFTEVRLLPAPIPPHKTVVGATFEQRIRMVELVCKAYPILQPELCEQDLPTPSYTVNTLAHLRKHNPTASIVFVIGEDSLLALDTWFQWQRLLDYCHIAVLPRPNCQATASAPLSDWLAKHHKSDKSVVNQMTNGAVFFAETPLRDVSSTQLREWLANPDLVSQAKQWLAPEVFTYIQQQQLYIN